MTPEEKAEKWVKEKYYQERDFEKLRGWETTVDIKEVELEAKQAYLAGYAERDKEATDRDKLLTENGEVFIKYLREICKESE